MLFVLSLLLYVLIPYQQGGLFRRLLRFTNRSSQRLNPLSTGRSFQTEKCFVVLDATCLNPLSTGRSFQTVCSIFLFVKQ